jgi:hypothetical protein
MGRKLVARRSSPSSGSLSITHGLESVDTAGSGGLVGPEGQQVLPVAEIRDHDPVALEVDIKRLMVGDGLAPCLPVPSQRHPQGEGVTIPPDRLGCWCGIVPG